MGPKITQSWLTGDGKPYGGVGSAFGVDVGGGRGGNGRYGVCFVPLNGQLFVRSLLDVDDDLLVHARAQLKALPVLVFGYGTVMEKRRELRTYALLYCTFSDLFL